MCLPGYPGLADLLALDRCRRASPGRHQVSPVLEGVISPLQWEVWREHLEAHPDRDYVEYLARGLREGFRIGFNY